MSQPTPYERLYSFTDYQTVNPANPLPATELDAELNAIALTAGQIRANLGLIQRDDGALANQTVTPDSLSAGALAMIHQGEYLPRGAWIAARAFALGDVVTYNAATYLCIVAHTSVTQFATDLAAGKWLLIANGALAGGGQAVDLFEGNGSTATFALSFTYNGNNAAVVFVGGVAQIPGQDFTISGSSITFVSAPPAPAVAGRKNVMVRGTGIEAQLAADGAATAAANASASATAAANSATAANASQSAAATSAANAATSATSAAGSATTATTKASEATTSASAAAASQTAAAASQTAAATSATNAANSATAAAGSATTATNQATTATNQATAAANSATAASNSATAAAGSASTASGAATTATNQASAASTSATAASTSASNAANSASQAATSASNAAASASSASSSASSANTSAVNAATSATNASNSATAAGTSAAAASTSATNAANSATTATTQATNASNSATAAAGSASAAAASAASAAAALDSFDDRYLGPKSADPTVDNDGNALVTGALYYRTTAPIGMKVWDGAQWLEASAAQQASLVTFEYVATAGQTTFSGADANGVTLSYTVGNALVSVNGVRLRPGDDFTATNGTSVVLVAAAAAGDEVLIDAFRTFEVANTYTQAQVDAALATKQAADAELTTLAGMSANRATFTASEQAFGMRNRIINGGLDIWQRGTSVGINASFFQWAADRLWIYAPNGTGTIERSTDVPDGFSYSLFNNATAACSIGTNVELTRQGNAAPFALNEWITLSFYVKGSGSSTVSFSYRDTSGGGGDVVIAGAANRNFNFTAGWTRISIPVQIDANPNANNRMLQFEFSLPPGARATGFQLESGAVATPFERRPYGTELALCQRYYQSVNYGGTWYASNTGVFVDMEDRALGGPQFFVPMRATPTTSITADGGASQSIRSWGGDPLRTITSLSVTTSGVSSVAHSGGYTLGRAYSATWKAEAEL